MASLQARLSLGMRAGRIAFELALAGEFATEVGFAELALQLMELESQMLDLQEQLLKLDRKKPSLRALPEQPADDAHELPF
jgi:hypothetical protein